MTKYVLAIMAVISCTLARSEPSANGNSANGTEKCGVLYTEAESGKETLKVLATLSVFSSTRGTGVFELPQDAPPGIKAIQCGRLSLVPAENDYKVVQAGFPLIIVAPDGRLAALEISDGRVQFQTLDGEFSDEGMPLIEAYLNSVQHYFNKPEN